ncbi:hypothetical protein HY990_05160 [Candidatus Micrarchaeota archaeon]|nr:hypothetical protein [Candidatus Micrarchaeota archaeon]
MGFFYIYGKSPLLLTLSISLEQKNLCISAFIKNISPSVQRFHHSYMFQSSELVFIDEFANEIRGYDYRERKDFDHTIYCESDYQTLVPGAESELDRACFVNLPNVPVFQWGPFQFQSFKPGKYWAYLEFDMLCNTWTDKKTDIRHELNDVWLGKIKSEKIGFVIK